MAVKLSVVRDDAVRTVDLRIDGAPDITPDQSNISFGIRPLSAIIEYRSEDGDAWTVREVTVTGLAVGKDGKTNPMSRRRHSMTYIDVHGAGGIAKAVTPAWVVSLVKKYADPDKLPHTH